MTKEADAIIYQVDEEDLLEKFGLEEWRMPFEIGLGDPKDRKEFKIHLNIGQEIQRKLGESIIERRPSLFWLNENKDKNLSLDIEWYDVMFRKDSNLRNFQEMLERYEIKNLWVFGEEKEKDIFKRMEKIVWDTQSSAYAQKQGMTNTEFLRWRLIGAKLEETGKEK